MRGPLLALVIVVTLITGVLYGGKVNQQIVSQRQYEVEQVCNAAHVEIDGASEQHCGDLQDAYQMEYLCDQTGTTCWTEVK